MSNATINEVSQEPFLSQPTIDGNFPLDDAIVAALPSGTKVLSANSFGSSAWSATAKIVAESPDGSPTGYFLKCTTGDSGKAQLKGEFLAMSELYSTVPTLVPKPHSWGKLIAPSPPTYFFLCEFVNISDRLPDPAVVGARLAELHRTSVSPTGKFGFHVSTFDGKLPQVVDWDSSWPNFFAKLIAGISKLDIEVNGPWKELQDVLDRVISHVIPRMLGALEWGGRKIKPCLIHGDLWEGNIGTDIETGNIFIFDSCAYYAHSEMEIGMWRVDHHRMKAKVYKKEYLRNMEIGEPVEEFDDRNRLYSVKTKLMYSAHVPGTRVRKQAYEDLCYLVDKYAAADSQGVEKTVYTADSQETQSLSGQTYTIHTQIMPRQPRAPEPPAQSSQIDGTALEELSSHISTTSLQDNFAAKNTDLVVI